MANINHLPNLSLAAQAARASWQYRAIERLRGNQTFLGTILLAALNQAPTNPPRILSGRVDMPLSMRTTIRLNGEIWTVYQERGESLSEAYAKGLRPLPGVTVNRMVDEFRELAHDLGLTADEKDALFRELRGWVAVDERNDASKLTENFDEV